MTKHTKGEEKDNLVFTSLWNNRARIEVFHYKEPIKGEYGLDRIQVLITPAGGKPRGWLMTAEEAVDLIYGLSKAASMQLERQNIYQEAKYRLEKTKEAIKKFENEGYSDDAKNLVFLKERAAELEGLLKRPEGDL